MYSPLRARIGAGCAVLALLLTGCGGGSDGSAKPGTLPATATATPAAQVTGSPATDAETVQITIDGRTVTPTGESRRIRRDQPVVLRISATEAGQLHVHSTPQQVVDYPAGDSEITLTFAIPGVVDVEDHAVGELIVNFEVD